MTRKVMLSVSKQVPSLRDIVENDIVIQDLSNKQLVD